MKIATHYTDIIISKIIITNCRNLKIRTHRECVATQPLAALRQAMACCSGVIQIRIFFLAWSSEWTPMAMMCGLVGMLLSPPRSLAWTGHFFVHPALYNLLLGRWYIHIFMMRRICCWSRCRKVDKKTGCVRNFSHDDGINHRASWRRFRLVNSRFSSANNNNSPGESVEAGWSSSCRGHQPSAALRRYCLRGLLMSMMMAGEVVWWINEGFFYIILSGDSKKRLMVYTWEPHC